MIMTVIDISQLEIETLIFVTECRSFVILKK